MVCGLLDDVADPLVPVVIQSGHGSLALLDVAALFNTKCVDEELRERVLADPKELIDTIINKVETIWNNALGREVDSRWKNDLASCRVRNAGRIWHVMQTVEFRVDVLNE